MLELKHLCFEAETDEGVRQILKDVNLTVDERMVVITGPNGGGKSTMAKLIAGIEQPTSGQILLDGEDITHMSITERARRGISFAFQQPVRFKGITVLRPASASPPARSSRPHEACDLPVRGRPVRAGLCQPRSERQPLRRRAQAHRDRDHARPRHEAVHLRRAGGRHRPLELPEPHQRVREAARDDPRQHPHHLPPGAHPGDRRRDRRARRRRGPARIGTRGRDAARAAWRRARVQPLADKV